MHGTNQYEDWNFAKLLKNSEYFPLDICASLIYCIISETENSQICYIK